MRQDFGDAVVAGAGRKVVELGVGEKLQSFECSAGSEGIIEDLRHWLRALTAPDRRHVLLVPGCNAEMAKEREVDEEMGVFLADLLDL